MITFLVWIPLVECLVIPTESQKDRYVLKKHESFEMDCNHKLETVTRVTWEYISTHNNKNRSETIYDSQQPNNLLKSGFEVSCQRHEAFISTCILKLLHARKEDSGNYICYVGQENEAIDSNLLKPITEIELVVKEPILKIAAVSKDASVILQCEHNIKNLTRARWSHVSLQGVITYSLFHMPAKETTNANFEALCEPHKPSCNLKILQANKESAGKYICLVGDSLEFEEKYGLDQMTHFIVIELVVGELECNENMSKGLTLIGENDCYGIEADVLNLKCSFNYFGNINYNLLHLRWIEKYKFNSLEKKLNSSLINHEVKDETNKISIQTNLSVAYEMQNSIFQCVLDDTKVKPCQLNEFRTQYVRNTTENPPSINSDELQNKMCTANKSANVQCSYYWTHESPGAILNNPFLPVENMKSPGIYTCFAKCQLVNRKDDCVIKAMHFEVVKGSKLSGLMIGLIIILFLTAATFIILCVYLKKFKKKRLKHQKKEIRKEEGCTLDELSEMLKKKGDDVDGDVKVQLRGEKLFSGQPSSDQASKLNKRKYKKIYRQIKSDYKLLEVKKILYQKKLTNHDVMIYESTQNGNVFMLDGAIWATELDSWNKKALIYPLISHEGAKHVLVIGGGDGAVVKYLLEHLEVEFVAVYEIDERIIQLWCKFFPSLDRSLDDPKVKVHIEDGNEFMRTQENAFDVIIILSTNVHDNYLVKEYYEVIKKALKNGGVASLIVTGKHTKYVTQCDVMEMDAMDLCDQIFPVVQYFYIPFQEHPGTLTRCVMCSLNPEMNFGHLYEMVLQKCRGKEMTIEEAIIKIFEGCNSSRIDFIKSVLKKKDIHTTEDLKTLDSNALESLNGLTDVEENKIKDFLERAAEEAFAIALKDAHVSRKNFFAEVFRENLALTDLKNLGPKYVVNSFKLLTRSEISKVQEIAENKLRTKFKKDIPEVLSGCKNQGIDLYTHRQNIIREDLLHKPLERCSWFRFELEEAFKRFNDDEIEQMKTFKTRKAIITVERIFKGLDSSRISFIKSVFKEHGISDTFDLKLDLILLEICGKLSTSELQMIKQSYKKWHEMTVEEALVEIFGATEDIRIRLLIEASKKFEDVYMAMEFISLTECITSFDDFEAFTYNEIFKMKKCVEKTLEESVAEALKDSGLLRINFVLKALMRKDLGGACRFIYYGDKLKCDATYPNLLNVFQELSETEISKIMAFHHKSLKEVINEILEGCDGSRIDFVTTTLNKYGIRKQIHLLKYPYELGNIEELTADEVNTIEEFIHKNKDMKHLLEIIGITDVNRITFILRLMKDHCINTSVELLKLDWPFFDILLGLRDSEVKKFKEFIHTKEMTIGETIKKIFKEWDSSRIDFIATTLRKKDVYTTEDLHSLDSNDWEELRGLTGDEVNKIKDFLERGATSESKMEGLNLV